jgi:hypothetical protein
MTLATAVRQCAPPILPCLSEPEFGEACHGAIDLPSKIPGGGDPVVHDLPPPHREARGDPPCAVSRSSPEQCHLRGPIEVMRQCCKHEKGRDIPKGTSQGFPGSCR